MKWFQLSQSRRTGELVVATQFAQSGLGRVPVPVPLREEQIPVSHTEVCKRGECQYPSDSGSVDSTYLMYLWKVTGPMLSQVTTINPSVEEVWYLQAGYLVPSMSWQTVILNFVKLWKHKVAEWFWQVIILGEVQTLLIFRGLSWMKTWSVLQVLSGPLMILCKTMWLQYLTGTSLCG